MGYSYVKTIPMNYEADVLVVGAGPAGFAAAVCAGRTGAKVMVVEQAGVPGGMATSGLVGPFMTCFDTNGEEQIIKGIFEELVVELVRRDGAIHPSEIPAGSSYAGFITKGHSNVTPFDPEVLKVTMVDFLEEAGVKMLFHTKVIDVIKEENTIVGVVVANKSGIHMIRAKQVIDCSGDADVAALAGCPYVLGNQEGSMQPATMFFRVYNVDSDKVKEYIRENSAKIGEPFQGPFSWVVRAARERGEWEIARNEIGMYETSTPGVWRINTTRILNVDGTDAEDLTRGEIEGRRQVHKLLDFLKKNIPGYENAKLMDTACVVGIRESRHIIGEYVMTKEDVLTGRVFDDNVMIASNSIDIHSSKNGDGEYRTIDGRWYGIPYRSLLPLESANLLVAGRSISATSEASSAFRVMPCCFATGQAAGVAAGLAVATGQALRKVDVKVLQDTLREQGVVLGD
jgi:glycine/D-amino acid oxidase-like deaminating enzyme